MKKWLEKKKLMKQLAEGLSYTSSFKSMCEYSFDLCDKTTKLKHKRRHSKTKSHMALSMAVINRFCIEDPKNLER